MTVQGPWPGRIVWHDLMTTDAAKSKKFYQELLDWQIDEQPIPGVTYCKLTVGPGSVGGIVEEKAIPRSQWIPYIAVDELDQAVARCTKLGGTVRVPPTDIPGTGRFAMLVDPQGAAFSIYKGNANNSGFDPDLPIPGRACWNEVMTTDAKAALGFYGAMFGWTDEAKDMGPTGVYHCQMLGRKQVCGIMKNPMNGAPTAWLAYFLVEDLGASTDKAKLLGAKAMMENAPIPNVGSFSMLADTTGAVFALFQGAETDGE